MSFHPQANSLASAAGSHDWCPPGFSCLVQSAACLVLPLGSWCSRQLCAPPKAPGPSSSQCQGSFVLTSETEPAWVRACAAEMRQGLQSSGGMMGRARLRFPATAGPWWSPFHSEPSGAASVKWDGSYLRFRVELDRMVNGGVFCKVSCLC